MNKVVRMEKQGDCMVLVVEAGNQWKKYGRDLLHIPLSKSEVSRLSVKPRDKGESIGSGDPLFDPDTRSIVLETEAAEHKLFELLVKEAKRQGVSAQELAMLQCLKAEGDPTVQHEPRGIALPTAEVPKGATWYGKNWAFFPATKSGRMARA